MQSIQKDEIDILYRNYEYSIDQLLKGKTLKEVLSATNEELREQFALAYKSLYFQVKFENAYKTKPEISYSILKLRRIAAIWHEMGVIEIDGGVTYKDSDKYRQFPLFASQSPTVYPTEKTLDRIRVKAIGLYIQEVNERERQGNGKGIHDLRQLRTHLIYNLEIDRETAEKYVRVFKYLRESRAINSFATTTDAKDIKDYNIKIFE